MSKQRTATADVPFEKARAAKEEKEQQEQREDRDLTVAVQQEQQHIQSHAQTATPENRYNVVIQAAQKRVMNTLERLENRLAKRETEAANRLTALTAKRPGRIARLFNKGKAMKAWSLAVEKQNKALFAIRKNKSRVKTIRTQASNFQREMRAWIRKRALRVDRDAVLVYDAAQEERRREAHQKSIDKIKEMEKSRTTEKGNEISRSPTLERTAPGQA